MSGKTKLLEALLDSFGNTQSPKEEAVAILREYSTEWIQSHRVLEQIHGIIKKFQVHSQASKYKALKSCVEHYQRTQDPTDENYCHIIHLLLALSYDPLKHNAGKQFRDFQTIQSQMEDLRKDGDNSDGMINAVMSGIAASEQLSEWSREWDECDDDLSDWTEDSRHSDSKHSEQFDDDDAIMDDVHCSTADADVQFRKGENNRNEIEEDIDTRQDHAHAPPLRVSEVTEYESLVAALMGVDTIYFKWRTDHFVCLGSGLRMTELCSLLEYANQYRDCKNIVDEMSKRSNQTPLCIRALFHVISECLQMYRERLHWFISSKYYGTESVLELSHFMEQSFVILECIYNDIVVCFREDLRENVLSTHRVVSHLYRLLQDIVHEEWSVRASTVMSLFLGTVRPYLDMMDEWMLSGRLIDPFNEFFVTQTRQSMNPDPSINTPPNIWTDFVLIPDKIPCFLNDLGISESILVCGKSWRILCHLQRSTHKEFKQTVKPYKSSFQYLQTLLSRYYPIESIAVISPHLAHLNRNQSSTKQMDIRSTKQSPTSPPIKDKSVDDELLCISNNRLTQSPLPVKGGKLNAIQMMTWIQSTDIVFAHTPTQSESITSPFTRSSAQQNEDRLLYEHYCDRQQRALTDTQDDVQCVDREVVHIPFEHIIRDEWLSQIDVYYHRMNLLLLESIDLLPHLLGLRLFYFVGASDILSPFLNSLVAILSSPGWSKQLRIADALQTAMADSVYRETLPERISVEWTVSPQTCAQDGAHREEVHRSSVIHQISLLDFNVSMEWPLNIVLNPPVLHCYNRIFKFLLQLQASKLLVERIDVRLRERTKMTSTGHDNVVHQFLMIRHKIYLFITTFNNYCSLQMDSPKWGEMLTEIKENGIGLDAICQKHDEFMKQMLQSLFLPQTEKEQNMITSHIGNLLLCSDDLRRCWENEVTQYLGFKEEVKNVKATSLFQHEKNKRFRLEDTALKRISMIHVKFERLYKFCVVTIEKVKQKSLSHEAINVGSHLDFSGFYADVFKLNRN